MVLFDNVANPKSSNLLTPGVENQEGLVVLLEVLEIALDYLDGFRPKSHIALLVSFSYQRDMIGLFQAQIVNLEINNFADAGPRVVEQGKQDVITKPQISWG